MDEKLYCSDCIHKDVCSLEGLLDEGMTFCASKKTEWIPVSERLPKKGGAYLISTDWGSVLIKTFSKNLRSVDSHDFKEKKSGWYSYDSEYGYYEWHNVVAWMPLPKAYKKEGD